MSDCIAPRSRAATILRMRAIRLASEGSISCPAGGGIRRSSTCGLARVASPAAARRQARRLQECAGSRKEHILRAFAFRLAFEEIHEQVTTRHEGFDFGIRQ